MSDEPEQTTQNTSFATILGPVILGQCACILFTGVLLAVFTRFIGSPAWTRASWGMRGVVCFVVAGSCASAALGVNDVWFYGVLATSDITAILKGTSAQCMEPVVLGVTTFVVQVVLCLRVAKVIPNKLLRWLFVGLLSATSYVSFFGSAAMTAWSLSYHLYPEIGDPRGDLTAALGMSWTTLFRLWLWTACSVDVSITLIYIFALRLKLRASSGGGSETSQSVFKLIVVGSIRCAAYTAILAATSAIITQKFGLESVNTYLICYAFWEPLAPLYGLTLFTTLSVADNIVSRLSDPNIRRTNGSKIGHSFNSAGGALPAFYVSDPSSNSNSGGDASGHGAAGGGRLNVEREGSMFGESQGGGGSGGGFSGPAFGTTSTRGTASGGVMVQVERKEEVDEGDKHFSMV